jgi:hypothetical protein
MWKICLAAKRIEVKERKMIAFSWLFGDVYFLFWFLWNPGNRIQIKMKTKLSLFGFEYINIIGFPVFKIERVPLRFAGKGISLYIYIYKPLFGCD